MCKSAGQGRGVEQMIRLQVRGCGDMAELLGWMIVDDPPPPDYCYRFRLPFEQFTAFESLIYNDVVIYSDVEFNGAMHQADRDSEPFLVLKAEGVSMETLCQLPAFTERTYRI